MKINKREFVIGLCLGSILLAGGIAGVISNSRGNFSCTPYNVFLSKEGDHKISVSWSTRDSCLGYVLYGDNSYEIERVAINPDYLGKSKDHTVIIPDLLSTNSYYFIIVSDESPYGNNGKPIAFSLEDL